MSDFIYHRRVRTPKMTRDDMGRLLPSWREWSHRVRVNALERRKTFSPGDDSADLMLWADFGRTLTDCETRP